MNPKAAHPARLAEPHTKTAFRHPTRGFTLIELLTVIAIIGVLAGILIPVIGRVRSSARQAQCLSNLRQSAMAITLFAQDNRDRFPGFGLSPTSRWPHQVAPYLGTVPDREASQGGVTIRVDRRAYSFPVFHCSETRPEEFQSADGIGNANGHFGMNRNLIPDDQLLGVPVNRVRTPSRTALLADKSARSADGIGSAGPALSIDAPFPERSAGVASNHGGGGTVRDHRSNPANYAFVDGSVRVIPSWPGPQIFDLDQ